jgi:hypothetical protein
VVEYLNKPKTYDMDLQNCYPVSKMNEKNSQYKRLGEDVARDHVSQAENRDEAGRRSHNERSF